jgi:hypothetical protein
MVSDFIFLVESAGCEEKSGFGGLTRFWLNGGFAGFEVRTRACKNGDRSVRRIGPPDRRSTIHPRSLRHIADYC